MRQVGAGIFGILQKYVYFRLTMIYRIVRMWGYSQSGVIGELPLNNEFGAGSL